MSFRDYGPANRRPAPMGHTVGRASSDGAVVDIEDAKTRTFSRSGPSSSPAATAAAGLTFASASQDMTHYQKMVSDLDQASRSSSLPAGRTQSELQRATQAMGNQVFERLNRLGDIIDRRGSHDGQDSDRASASFSKLRRDYQRIRAKHNELVQLLGDRSKVETASWNARDDEISTDIRSGVRDDGGYRTVAVMQNEEEYSKEVMLKREAEIQQITEKMNAVNEIYKDLGNIVTEQQDLIDAVENMVDESDQNAAYGLDQLERANKGWTNPFKMGQHGEDSMDRKKVQDGNHIKSDESEPTCECGLGEFQEDMEAIGNGFAARFKALDLAIKAICCGSVPM